MNEGKPRRQAETTRIRERPDGRLAARPDRIALWAFALAVMVMVMAAVSAHASSGGTTLSSGTSSGGSTTTATHEGRYVRIWDRLSYRDHRWAHRTSMCESGGDPKAIGGGGKYRGAFQFTKPTWRSAPKSPGGDPIRYRWKTQAVVAVLLKHRVGSNPWPVCG
jgi:Transglycosylase-like domain